MTTRIYIFVALISCCVTYLARSEPTTWLMQGDIFTNEEAESQLIQLDTHKTYFPVSTKVEIFFRARRGKFITCVIAAAVHQNGHVNVVEGGYKAKKVRVRYTTENGKPDVFFVFVQAARREPVSVEGNIVRSARVDIVYEPVRNWTLEEIQNTLRNMTTSFLIS